jgi:hypothetical protein
MDADIDRPVTISQSSAIAISRLLWSLGSRDSTGHQDQVDCFHWGAHLDHVAGLPPHPTSAESMREVVAFYHGIRSAIDDRIRDLEAGNSLRDSDAPVE